MCLNLNQEVSNTNKNFNEEKNITKEIPQPKQVDKTVKSNTNKFKKRIYTKILFGNKKINKKRKLIFDEWRNKIKKTD